MCRLNVNPLISLLFGLLALVTCLYPAYSQEKTVVPSNQQWIQYYGQSPLTEHWYLTGDIGFRWKDGLTAAHQNIIRAGALYRPGKLWHMGGGLAYSGIYEAGKVEQIEWRVYEEAGIMNKFRKWELTHRLRVEQRFRHPTPFTLRLRYAFMASIPLFVLSSTNSDFRLSLITGDELFINLQGATSSSLFDQNRFLAGPSLALSNALSIAILWNSQFAATKLPSTYSQTHVVWLQFRHQINLPKKEKKI